MNRIGSRSLVKFFVFSTLLLMLTEQISRSAPLPQDIDHFLPSIPAALKNSYTSGAKALKKAVDDKQKKSWRKIPATSPFFDIASYELARALVEGNKFLQAKIILQKLLADFPFSPRANDSKTLLEEVEWNLLLLDAKTSLHKPVITQKKVFNTLLNQLEKTPWKQWVDHEELVSLSLQLAEKINSPQLQSWKAEVLVALPADSILRQQLVKKIGDADVKKLLNFARFKPIPNPSGVKSINPDAQAFESAMDLVLQEKWLEARNAFTKILEQFPTTEFLDKLKFWIANCNFELGEKDKAKEKFQELIQESPLSYYAYASAQKIDFDLKIFLKESSAEKSSPSLEGTLLPRQEKALWRIRALLQENLFLYASQELEALFNYRPQGVSLGQTVPLNMLAMAKLYFIGTYYLGAFGHSYVAFYQDHGLIQKDNLTYFFPTPYSEIAKKYAEISGLEINLLYSVMKQESGFIPTAISKSDAMGLMQLLPSTAKDIEKDLNKKELLEQEKNIRLGSLYLKKLLEKFSGNIPLALAGYNAGPQRAQQWQKKLLESPLMKKEFRTDVFVDTIPYQETHKYVGNILRNIFWYKILY